MKSKAAVRRIIETLKGIYPDSLCSLQYEKDYELLFAVRLAAQCTDERVNQVTPALYSRFPTLESFAEADPKEVGEYIHSCGFFNGKARDIVACAKQLIEKHGGRVPGTMEELTALPGVGRKTANLILGDIFGQPAYVCDTHCIRITGKLGITDGSKDPIKVERQLRECIPPEECCWGGILVWPEAPVVKNALSSRIATPEKKDKRAKCLCESAGTFLSLHSYTGLKQLYRYIGGSMNDMTAKLAEQLKSNPAALRSLMQSQDGQALIRMLTQGDRGAGLQQAAQAAAKGNPAQLTDMINRMMQSPEGAALIERINKAVQK